MRKDSLAYFYNHSGYGDKTPGSRLAKVVSCATLVISIGSDEPHVENKINTTR